jgi:two-component sensor histidine kinase
MAASLPNEPDDLLITDELHHRIAHKADYQREKLAIQDLARQMAEQPDQVLPRLVHLAMELCGGQSAFARTGDPKRIVMSGPDLVIGERALTSLALVLHELATNAVKYGALSIDQGLVHVTWQIEADNLLLRWEERKGPGLL